MLQPLHSVEKASHFMHAGYHDCSPAVYNSTLQTWHTSLQALRRMRAQLESLKADIKDLRGEATANKFSEEDLQLLWDKRCRDQEDLKVGVK